MEETESRWLDYAWSVVDCPDDHRRECIARGAASGAGVDGGNAVRFPGYLGRSFEAGRGVLCVAHVHREPESSSDRFGDPEQFVAAHVQWREAGRSESADERFLAEVRRHYEEALRFWGPWRQSFRAVVEDALSMDKTQVAYTNLAKCRLSISSSGATEMGLYCQSQYPVSELVSAVRPGAVLVRVLAADPARGAVRWAAPDWAPPVYAFHGRTQCDPRGRPRHVWASEVAAQLQRGSAA